jgi:hypothetical protein
MSVRSEAVRIALAEWQWFGSDTGRQDRLVRVDGKEVRKEAVPPYAERVHDYWLAVPLGSYQWLVRKYAPKHGRLDGTVNLPWSAAFISFVMAEAGASDEFPYAAGHASWIRQAIKARAAGGAAPLIGYRPGEMPLQPGDIIGRARNDSGVTYETAPQTKWFESHSDIVVDAAARKAYAIGGNIGQSVSRIEVAVDALGRLAEDGWMVHISNQIDDVVVAAIADDLLVRAG